MAAVLPNGKQQYFGSDGLFLNGGLLYTYQAGTLTPKPTYQDAEATVENTNPVVLDERGEATIFWVGSYDITLSDALDNIIYSVPGLSEPTADYRTSETGSAIIPAGSTSQRDDPAQPGYFRFNVETNLFEGYVDAQWKSFQELLISETNIKTINTESLLGAGNINLPVTLKTIVHSVDTPITQANLSTIVVFAPAGDINQTINAAADYEDGFWFIARNDSTHLITLVPTDTPIDGQAGYIMYPGESRLFQFTEVDGAFNSIILASFSYRFAASGNFVKPPRYTSFDTVNQGPGAGAGGGEGRAAGTARAGGSGGAGGSKVIRRIPASALAGTSSVLVGSGGAGGTGGTLSTGSSGSIGGTTSLTSAGVVLSASYSGGPGVGGSAGGATVGGSGAGVGGPGAIGSTAGVTGGLPANANIGGPTSAVVNNWGGGGAGNSPTAVGNAEYGGGAGGGSAAAGGATIVGGGSLHAAGGGGSGAGSSAANVASLPSRGGASMTYTGGTGGAAGTNGINGTGGTNGVTDGEGGGGAGSGSAGVGGQGGTGAKGAGGGGGGAGTGAAGGPGGNGGDGYFDIKGVM